MTASSTKPLKELREERGYTIHDLVRLAGIDQDSLRLWELGQREIDLARLDRVAKAYGVTIDQIQLEPHRRHYVNQEYRIVLHSNGHPRSGFRAKVGLLDASSVPEVSNVLAGVVKLEGRGDTADAALESLAHQLDEYFAARAHTERSPK